ncbi:Uncharacterised protein [Enterobacter roggenkampii]|uniref:Uncharacterized protein n=1 Tax=Enterobacter roggenkampii TaxID=1812935 RepID=A0ABY0J9H5_9ENTR|nr:Uncharacterised protein [Enterobacter roggenkampii]
MSQITRFFITVKLKRIVINVFLFRLIDILLTFHQPLFCIYVWQLYSAFLEGMGTNPDEGSIYFITSFQQCFVFIQSIITVNDNLKVNWLIYKSNIIFRCHICITNKTFRNTDTRQGWHFFIISSL